MNSTAPSSDSQNMTISTVLDATPQRVFDAIRDVRSWWSADVVGTSAEVGDSFVFEVPGVHRNVMTVVESRPAERIVWEASDSWISFVADTAEWDGTRVVFDLEPVGEGTRLIFTHEGLTPSVECFDACFGGWSMYVGSSLPTLVTTGLGDPHRHDEGLQDREKELLDEHAGL